MKLIDADVLKADLTRFYDNEVTAKRLIDEQPTIDAIPLSWIIAWCFKRYMETEVEVSVPTMIEAWWKEQEART